MGDDFGSGWIELIELVLIVLEPARKTHKPGQVMNANSQPKKPKEPDVEYVTDPDRTVVGGVKYRYGNDGPDQTNEDCPNKRLPPVGKLNKKEFQAIQITFIFHGWNDVVANPQQDIACGPVAQWDGYRD